MYAYLSSTHLCTTSAVYNSRAVYLHSVFYSVVPQYTAYTTTFFPHANVQYSSDHFLFFIIFNHSLPYLLSCLFSSSFLAMYLFLCHTVRLM